MSSINYVKIAKKDSSGNDNTLSLQQLHDFIVKYSLPLNTDYVITNITEYPTYFLYQIVLNGSSYSNDTEIKDYKVSASNSVGISIPANTSILNPRTASFNTINSNPIGYLTGSSGIYMLHNTPNVPLYYTFSCDISSSTSNTVDPVVFISILNKNPNFNLVSTSSLITGSLMLTGSFTPIENEQYRINFSEVGGLSGYSASNIYLSITQSFSPQAGTSDLVVLNPNVITKFSDSDYNILYGNEDSLLKNTYFFKADYSNYNISSENFNLIISGSAVKADVKDYYYNLNRQIIPRYIGSRTVSNGFNLSSNGLGTAPNVERTTPFFLYFTQMIDDSPLVKDVTSILIKYLIDENGNVFSPSTTDSTYFDLIDSFEVGKNAYANLLSSTTNVFNKNQTIKLSGNFYKPILYNLSSSFLNSASFSTIIDFLNLQGNSISGAPDYGFYRESLKNGTQLMTLTSGSNGTYLVNGVLNPFYPGIDSSVGYDLQSGYTSTVPSTTDPYYIFNGIPQTSVNITAKIQPHGNSFSSGDFANIQLQIVSNINGILKVTNFQVNFSNYYNGIVTTTLNNYYPQTNERIYINVKYLNGTQPVIINSGNIPLFVSYFQIVTNGLTTPSVSTPFWTTGSINSNVLTSSQALGLAIQGNYIQKDIPGSGFPNIEDPAQIFVGDEIRFEYDENNTYLIRDVQSFNSSSICIFLDRYVPSTPSININHFTIRRPFKNTTLGVTLNAKLTNNITNGFLFPEFPTQKLKDNLPNIIQMLQQKNLI